MADFLLKYRTMRLFLILLIFSILMRRENHTEIHKRTFEKYYSNQANVCYFFKTVDSYIFVFFLKLSVFWFTCTSHAVRGHCIEPKPLAFILPLFFVTA